MCIRDSPAVVGIDLLTAAKLVIDVMNRCVYSHHHARLEVAPATADKDGGPVLCVDNAKTFNTSGASATPTATTVSDIADDNTASKVSEPDHISTPEDDASLLSPPDAPTRPATLAPRSQLSLSLIHI